MSKLVRRANPVLAKMAPSPLGGRRKPQPLRPNFDRDAAREAWRQVARVRSGRNLLGAPPKKRGPSLILAILLGLGALVLVAKWDKDERKSQRRHDTVVAKNTPQASAPSATNRDAVRPPVVAPTEPSDRGANRRRSVRVPTPAAASPTRTPPRGTPKSRAKALQRIPHSRRDLAPVGGIGDTGLHVDRVTLGTSYKTGHCAGPSDDFVVQRGNVISLCIRAVHLRQQERIQVRWERQGRVLRRAWLTIPAVHAYRTRATLRLRKGYKGHWRVRVLSHDGTELAQTTFTIKG